MTGFEQDFQGVQSPKEFYDHLTNLQTVISESRINFECNLKKSKQSLNSRIEFLQAKLAEIETFGQESLDQLAQSRRYDFEQINLAITTDIRPETFKLCTKKESNCMEELKLLQGQVDQLLRVTDTAAIEKIIVDYDETLLKLFNGSTDNFVFAKSDVDAEDMSIFVHSAPKDRNTMEISFSLKQTAVNMSPLLYSDIFLTISLTSENAVKIVENKSLRFLIANGLASVTAEACQIEVVIPLDKEFENYTGDLQVRLLGHLIGKVPINPIQDQYLKLVKSFQKIEELNGLDISTVGGFKVLDQYCPNVTRTGKWTEDLDESDLNACGYNKSKVGTIIEPNDTTLEGDCDVPNQKVAKVSFHENTRIHDGVQAENGLTKQDDGNQALHKSLLQKCRIENGNADDFDFTLSKSADFDRKSVFEDADEQDILAGNRKSADFDRKSADFDRKSADFDRKSADFDRKSVERLAQPPYFWEHPDESYKRKVKENEERITPPLSPHESWSEEVFVDPTLNILDLSNNKWNLKEFRTIHMPKGESMPQSVAANGSKIYVSDPYNGRIHLFEKGNYMGLWPPTMHFNIPRYVLCVPSIENPNGPQDILVMDEDRIILLDVQGNIQNELVDSQIRKFRGLSYVSIQNKINLVTTEKTRHAVKLVFLHLENLNNGVLRKMDLSKDIYGEIEFIAAKCVFVKASANNIYVTDLGNGFVLDTDTQFWKTRKVSLTQGRSMKNLMGIELDPMENIIVATSHDRANESNCDLEIFNAKGFHQRTIQLKDLKPSGICLVDGKLYLADVLKKKIVCFNITDT